MHAEPIIATVDRVERSMDYHGNAFSLFQTAIVLESRVRERTQQLEDTLRELLTVQKQELALKLKEVERDNAEINLNKSVAQQSIEAQERDRKHDREEQTKRQKTHQNFVLVAVVAVLAFSGYAMHVGQSALVLDLAKLLFGFVAGMGYATYKSNKQSDDD